MAKYYVNCSGCGQEMMVQLFGKTRDREYKLDHWVWECDECLAKQRAAENAASAEENAENGFVQLVGSEKQIAWAEMIRANKIKKIADAAERDFPTLINVVSLSADLSEKYIATNLSREEMSVYFPKVYGHFALIESARWWIDSRNDDTMHLVAHAILKMIKADKVEAIESHPAALDAKVEATMRPETPRTETVATITAKKDQIQISFPEKREDFREIVKNKGFTWDSDSSFWYRAITLKTGTAENRAAEIGNILLGKGFPICCFDEHIRQSIANATFEPECTRWVIALTGGPQNGWFCISWKKGGDFYREAKKITRSMYSSPDVLVPPEHFAEVQDFAEINGFKLSPGALKIIADQKELLAATPIVSPKKASKVESPDSSTRPELDPEQVTGEVDDDLLDD